MYKVKLRANNRIRRKLKIRETLVGTPERPRLTVFRSNKYIYAQVIDDTTGRTLVDVASDVKKMHEKKTKVEASKEIGKLLAERALEKGIKSVAFDRNGYKFHGRVKSLADAVREGGLSL